MSRSKAASLVLALSVSLQSQQIISTYAGTEWLFPNTAHLALSSPLSSSISTTVDKQGNLIIADGLNHIVARISENRELTILAGNGVPGFSGDGGEALQASLNNPIGVVFDSDGNLLIADAGNFRIRRVTPAGIITTIAGNGRAAHSGDGGAATGAGFTPLAVAVDSSNAILIADTASYRVRRVGVDGVISTIAGTGKPEFSGEGRPGREASLTPTAIHVDRQGRILIADSENCRVYRIGADSLLTTVAGTGECGFSGDGGPALAAQINSPFALTTDVAGNILITNTNNYVLRRITPQGTISTIAGGGEAPVTSAAVPALEADIGFPSSLAADPQGRVYIADTEKQVVLMLSADATVISRVAGNGQFKAVPPGTPAPLVTMTEPSGVAIAPDGSVYYVELSGHRVVRLDPRRGAAVVAGNGVPSCCGDDGPAANGLLSNPNSIAFAPDGALIIVDGGGQKIRRISQGVITSIAGSTFRSGFSGDGGPATQALLQDPWGLAIDPGGNIFFIDRGNNRVRRIDQKGIITTVAGNGKSGFSGDGGPATEASLNLPFALAISANGDLLIADYLNSRIRAVSPAGIIRTLAGNGTFTYGGDGGPAAQAGIDGPYALAADSRGNVYISHDNSVIRRISPDGVISTVAGLFSSNGFSGDGGSPATAALNYPLGLAIDAAGTLYIADSGNNRIRVIRNLSVSSTISPASVSLSAIAGSGSSATAQLTVASSVNGIPFTSAVTYGQSAGNWLTVLASSSNAPATLTLTADASALPQGRYTASIQLNTNPVGPSNSVSVVLTVAERPATLTLSAQSLSFGRNEGATEEVNALEIRNDGGGVLSYQLTATMSTPGQWLRVAPASGSLRAGQVASALVGVNPAGLKPGTYLGSVTASTGANRTVVPVTLSVRAARPAILVSQNGLTFTAVVGGGAPTAQRVAIVNSGSRSLNWRATAARGIFVRLGTPSGIVNAARLEVGELTVSVAPAGYSPGQYYDQIAITGDGDNSPQLVTVLMNVVPEGANPGPDVTPSGLLFVTKAGQNPGSQTVTYNNLSSSPLTFEVFGGAIGASRGESWFKTAPSFGRASANSPGSIVIQPALAGLPPGFYRGVLTLVDDANGPTRNVNLLAVVAPSDSGNKSTRNAGNCPEGPLAIVPTAPSERFSARVAEAMTIGARVVDNCGNPITPDSAGGNGRVYAKFSNGDQQIGLTHIGNGQWSGAWVPTRANSDGTVTVWAISSSGSALNPRLVGGERVLPGSVVSQRPAGAPLLTAAGVVHAASQESSVPIAPGSLITLYGTQLADGVGPADGIPLPSTLNGTEVRLGNRSLPLLYTSGTQLNAQVPYDLNVNTLHPISVKRGEAYSVVETLTVSSAQPGIFTKPEINRTQGAIVKQDGVTLAAPGSPARRGEVVIIYCSGLGPVSPPVEAGLPAPRSPLSTVVNPVAVTIGGQPAQVTFAGLSPGFSGLYQVNAIVPANASIGNAVEVAIDVGGHRSPVVTVALQ